MWILTTVSYALHAECVLYSIWCLSVSLFFCLPASKMWILFMCTMVRKVKWKQKAVQSCYENDSENFLHGWPPWSMHMASLQQQQNASLALSMYFLCCFKQLSKPLIELHNW